MRVVNRAALVAVAALVASSVSGIAVTAVMAQDSAADKVTPVTDDVLRNPSDNDWLMWRRTYDGWGYSPLDQINKDNVDKLQLAWSWGMSPGGRTQETPVVYDGIIYIQNSTHLIQALDATNGDLIWEYQYALPSGVNPSGERSKAIYGDNLIVATRDGHVIALDLKSGKLAWDTQISDYKKGFGLSSGPIVADGVVIQGVTDCINAQPGGCYMVGLDATTGEQLWKLNTIADGDTPEGNSWNGIPWESRHGASAWISGSYDPDQDLVFAGVGQPYPWPAVVNGLLPKNPDPKYTNDALYTDSTLAIVPKTGEIKWYHQYLATDTLDLDYVFERLLIDLPVNGETRKTVITTGKLGIIEALDRTTGEWLWAKESVPQNVVLSIDEKTGEKTINPDVIPEVGKTTVNCPADPGSKAWQATAYSPRTQTLYLPTVEFCSNTTVQPLDPGTIYTGGGRATFNRVVRPDSDGNVGQVRAIRMTDRESVWEYRQHAPVTSSTLPTAGGVVFVGTLDRYLLAFDDETGDILWRSPRMINALESFPISYAVDGKQYIAVVANWASGLGRLASITPDVKLPPNNPAALLVFALPD